MASGSRHESGRRSNANPLLASANERPVPARCEGVVCAHFECLTDIPALSALTEADETDLARVACRRRVPARCIVLLEGERTNLTFILIRGSAESVRFEEDGAKTLLQYHQPGDVMGRLPGAIDEPLPSTLMSIGECEFLVIPQPELASLVVRRNGPLGLCFLTQVQRQQRRAERRIRYLTRRSGLQKIAGYLRERALQVGEVDEHGRLVLRESISHQAVADACGLSRETVCRLVPKLGSEGIVPHEGLGWTVEGTVAGNLLPVAAKP